MSVQRAGNRMLDLVGGWKPENEVEEVLYQMLVQAASNGEVTPLEELEERLAEELFHRDKLLGAWEVDIGLWGPRLYRAQAQQAIAALRGKETVQGMGRKMA